jgi:glucokinase
MFDKKYTNESFSSFSDVLRTFLRESNCPGRPVTACIAFAGPVKGIYSFPLCLRSMKYEFQVTVRSLQTEVAGKLMETASKKNLVLSRC